MEIQPVGKQTPGRGPSPAPIVLEPRERDAVVSHLLAILGQLGDLESAIDRRAEEECYRIGRDLLDALQLILEGGLGWRERTVEPTSLTLPRERLHSIMARLKEGARSLQEARRREHQAEQEGWDEISVLNEVFDSVMQKTG
jgi:hypothetical protein